jgi:hypothetical protein
MLTPNVESIITKRKKEKKVYATIILKFLVTLKVNFVSDIHSKQI